MLGASGLLAFDMIRMYEQQGWHVFRLAKDELDVTDRDQTSRMLSELLPDVVINTAAYMNADRCEQDPLQAYKVNALGARNVARACEAVGAIHIWFSSDFVFDGRRRHPYVEDDPVNPLMVYGVTKAAGEMEVRGNSAKHYIVRTSGLFGAGGSHFIERMLLKAKRNEPLAIVDDIYMSPCYTKDLAATVYGIVEQELDYGTYHVVNDGVASWYGLCQEAFSILGISSAIEPIYMEERYRTDPSLAKRPLYTAMSSNRLQIGGLATENWRSALRSYLTEKGYTSH